MINSVGKLSQVLGAMEAMLGTGEGALSSTVSPAKASKPQHQCSSQCTLWAQPEGLQDFPRDHVRLSEGEDFFTLDKGTLIAAKE